MKSWGLVSILLTISKTLQFLLISRRIINLITLTKNTEAGQDGKVTNIRQDPSADWTSSWVTTRMRCSLLNETFEWLFVIWCKATAQIYLDNRCLMVDFIFDLLSVTRWVWIEQKKKEKQRQKKEFVKFSTRIWKPWEANKKVFFHLWKSVIFFFFFSMIIFLHFF